MELFSGQYFYEYCEENIFIPLNMNNTSFYCSDFNEDEIALPYEWNSSSGGYDRFEKILLLHYPCGGLFTSVLDLSHLMIAHMNDGVF